MRVRFNVFALLIVFVGQAALAEFYPRYKFTPGTQVFYTSKHILAPKEDEKDKKPEITLGELRLIPIRFNRDGSVRLLAWSKMQMKHRMLAMAYKVDIFADGTKKVVNNKAHDFQFLPKLPTRLVHWSRGWTEFNLSTEGHRIYSKPVNAPYNQLDFTAVEGDAFWRLSKMGSKPEFNFQFDKINGVVTVMERKWWRYTNRHTIERIEPLSQNALAAILSAQADFDELMKRYEALCEEAYNGDDTPLQKAHALLEQAFKAKTHPMIKPQIQAYLDNHKYRVSRADWHRAINTKVMNKVAPEFKGDDIRTGEAVDLKNYRGKVVLLDFWAGWCQPCVQALPKLNRLKKLFSADEFQVIGSNLDINLENAKRAVDFLGIETPNLFGRQATKDFAVRPIPTLFIIDKKGVIRHAKIGTTYKMEDELAKIIKDLLKE